MDQVSPELIDAAQGFWSRTELFFETLLIPSRFYQLGAVIGLIVFAWLVTRAVSPLLTGWLRSRENWPKWRLRLGLLIDRRLTLIVFALLAWGVVLVMREVTWPSRSQLIALAGTIATAWIGFSSLPGSFQTGSCAA